VDGRRKNPGKLSEIPLRPDLQQERVLIPELIHRRRGFGAVAAQGGGAREVLVQMEPLRFGREPP
jgi:hypothetical protein